MVSVIYCSLSSPSPLTHSLNITTTITSVRLTLFSFSEQGPPEHSTRLWAGLCAGLAAWFKSSSISSQLGNLGLITKLLRASSELERATVSFFRISSEAHKFIYVEASALEIKVMFLGPADVMEVNTANSHMAHCTVLIPDLVA